MNGIAMPGPTILFRKKWAFDSAPLGSAFFEKLLPALAGISPAGSRYAHACKAAQLRQGQGLRPAKGAGFPLRSNCAPTGRKLLFVSIEKKDDKIFFRNFRPFDFAQDGFRKKNSRKIRKNRKNRRLEGGRLFRWDAGKGRAR